MLILKILHIVTVIFSWLTVFCAAGVVAVLIYERSRKKSLRFLHWCAMIGCALYAVGFIVCKIWISDLLDKIWGVVFAFILIVGWIFSRYEDRRTGRRWWNW